MGRAVCPHRTAGGSRRRSPRRAAAPEDRRRWRGTVRRRAPGARRSQGGAYVRCAGAARACWEPGSGGCADMCQTGPPREDVEDLGQRRSRSTSTRLPPRPDATSRRSLAAEPSSNPAEAEHQTREVRTKPSVPGTRSTHCQSSTTLYSSISPSSLPTATARPSGVGATAVMAAGVQSTNRARCSVSLPPSGGISSPERPNHRPSGAEARPSCPNESSVPRASAYLSFPAQRGCTS